MRKEEGGKIYVDQLTHAQRIEQLPIDCSFDTFRSRGHMLALLGQSRPDVSASANILSQVTDETFPERHVKALNKVIKHVKDTQARVLVHSPLDEDNLRIVAISDSSFANNADMSTQLVYIILLTDGSGNENIMHYASYKSKRVVRPEPGGESHAFADAFDAAYSIRNELKRILRKEIHLTMLTDSMSLFKVLINSSVMSEKRLMIDVARHGKPTNEVR